MTDIFPELKSKKLPFACELYSDGGEVANPFSGEKCTLNADALSVYDTIKGAEYLANYDTVRKGLDWFRQHYPKEYMVLLD
tara:strand:- start:257 stop:499 length:243 start_codon:yes stop_codon:yes gene_type:complete